MYIDLEMASIFYFGFWVVFLLSELFSSLPSFFLPGGCIQIGKGGKTHLEDTLLVLLKVGSIIKLFSYFPHFPL